MRFDNAEPQYFDVRTRPGAGRLQRRVSLDDFLQLQSLLRHEQAMREHHDSRGHEPQQRGYIQPSSQQLQQLRLQQALHNLKQLKDQYRRERCRQVQRYLDAYRRQALIQAARKEEEERFYRQIVAAALEQRRVDSLWRRYTDSRPVKPYATESLHKTQLGSHHVSPQQLEEEDSDEDQGFGDYHSKQLAALLKLIFDGRENVPYSVQEQEEETEEEDWEKQHDEDGEEAMKEVWKTYLSHQPNERLQGAEKGTAAMSPENDDQQDDSTSSAREGTDTDSAPAAVKALPPLQNHVLTLQDLINELVTAEPKEKVPARAPAVETMPQKSPVVFMQQDQPYIEPTEEEGVFEPKQIITEAEPTPINEEFPTSPFGKPNAVAETDHIAKEQQQKQHDDSTQIQREMALRQKHLEDEKRRQEEYQRQHHEELRRQRQEELLRQQEGLLRQKQQQEEIKRQQQKERQRQQNEELQQQQKEEFQKQQQEELQRQQQEAYQKQQQAEYQRQQMMEHQQQTQHEENEKERREQPSKTSSDPTTEKKRKELQDIAAQLEEVQQKYKDALHAPLEFKKPEEGQSGTLVLPASSGNNREFLGFEDEIMRCMLKLDAIISDGNDEIRAERRALIKRAEAILERLDDHKQSEWEKARKKSHKRHKHKPHRDASKQLAHA